MMIGRRKYSLLVTGLLAILFIASLTTTVYAYELEEGPALPESGTMTPKQALAGERIRQASLNWADYVGEPAVVVAPKQALAGERIRQASLNWADYVEEPAVVVAPKQVWAGERISQASLNWADYAEEPAVAQIAD